MENSVVSPHGAANNVYDVFDATASETTTDDSTSSSMRKISAGCRIPPAIPEGRDEPEDDAVDKDLAKNVAKAVLGVEEAAREDNDSSESSSVDSQGNLRKTSTLAKAASFLQMEKARGREPSMHSISPASPLENRGNKSIPTFYETIQAYAHREREQEEADENEAANDHLLLEGVPISQAQLKLMGVNSRHELRAQFDKILAQREKQKWRTGPVQEQPGPAVGKASLEAMVDAILRRQNRPGSKIEMSRVSSLAKREPEDKRKKAALMRPDDERNCTFAPRTKTRKSIETMRQCGYDFVDKGGNDENRHAFCAEAFVERLSRTDKHRRQKLEHMRGKSAYELKFDKKRCPRCGAVQSYDEVVDKRKKCQECGIEYRVPRPKGSEGLERWLSQQAERERESQHRRRQAEHRDIARPTIHCNLSHNRALRAKVDAEIGSAFLERVSRDIEKRKREALAREQRKVQQAVAKPPPPPPPKKNRSCDTPAATFPAPPKVTPLISKWEDDLEEYVRRASITRQRRIESDRQRSAGVWHNKSKRGSSRQGTTALDHTRPRASAKNCRRRTEKDRSSPDLSRQASIDLAKFDELLLYS